MVVGTLASCTTARQARTSAGAGAVTFAIGAGIAGASIKADWEGNQTAVGVGASTAAGGLLVATVSLISLLVLRD